MKGVRKLEEEIKAVVQKIIQEGDHGPFAVATSESIDGSITFSLEPTVWKENEWPEQGLVIVLGKLRKKRSGWRAKEGRFLKPSDEQTETRNQERRKEMNVLERVDNLISGLNEDALKEIKKLRRLMTLYDSLVDRAKENNVAIIVHAQYGEKDQLLIKILPSGKYCQTSTKKLNSDKWEWSGELPRNSIVGKHGIAIEDYLRSENKIQSLFIGLEKNSPDIQIRIEKL